MNSVTLIGFIGAIDLRYTPSTQAVCNIRMATNESWKDKEGVKHEKTEWHRVVVWGERAENCARYLEKGRQICVEGKLATRSWDKDGVKHYSTEIVAHNVQFLGKKVDKEENSQMDLPQGDSPDSMDVPL